MNLVRIIPTILLIGTFSMSAQAKDVDEGTLSLAGKIGLTFRTGDRYRSRSYGPTNEEIEMIKASAKPAYYAFQNIGFGLNLEYDSSTSKVSDSAVTQSMAILGPTVLYDISLNEYANLRLSGTAALWQLETKLTLSGASSTNTRNGIAAIAEGALVYFLRKDISVDAGMYYIRMSEQFTSSTDKLSVKGIEFFVGASLYFL